MPKETFFNLPNDKREKIIDIAFEEFARYDYRTASISRIVEKAGIAKGSMYQYFDNKKELYLYLIGLAADIKFKYINEALDANESDFFNIYKELLLLAAQFDLTHIHISQLLNNAYKEPYNEDLGNIYSKIMQMSDHYLNEFIIKAQDTGQLRNDIEADLLAFLISRISILMAEYNSYKFNFSYEKLLAQGGELPIKQDQLDAVLKQLIEFLKTGIEKR